MNDIVEENFWDNKDDVESVLFAAYAKLETSDCITRMSFWGEMRSDNIVEGSQGASEDIREVLTKDNLMSSNSFVSWSAFYDVINLANTVLENAEKVKAKDPNYTKDQMRAHMAEARALRALSYFYLIRAFKDVPYVTKASKDDSEDFRIAASSFEFILNSEIESLKETVPSYGTEWANKKFADDNETVGRFTRAGIYTLLADMTLWAGDYQSCIAYCDNVIKLKKEQYKEYKENHRTTSVVDLYNGYPLIRPENEDRLGNAYNNIFGDGASFESIFELVFVRDQAVTNGFVSNYYGSSSMRQSNQIGYLAANGTLSLEGSSSNKLFNKDDTRYHEAISFNKDGEGLINKYVLLAQRYDVTGNTAVKDLDYPKYRPDAVSPNWILYRFTDVLLIQAEAMACMASSTSDPLVKSAITNVNAVYRRATNDVRKDTLTVQMFSQKSLRDLEESILDERRREFMFEGKRWFDMLRICRRRGNTDYVRNNVISKFKENREAISVRLTNLDALYFPISKSELKINPNLKQNPIYKENEDISKSK